MNNAILCIDEFMSDFYHFIYPSNQLAISYMMGIFVANRLIRNRSGFQGGGLYLLFHICCRFLLA